jgi:hypothetical protein
VRACFVAIGLLASSNAFAQRASVAMENGPHYAGEPVLVRVSAEGFDETPQPTCEPQNVDPGLSIKLVNVAPQTSSFVQFINGQQTSHKTVIL